MENQKLIAATANISLYVYLLISSIIIMITAHKFVQANKINSVDEEIVKIILSIVSIIGFGCFFWLIFYLK